MKILSLLSTFLFLLHAQTISASETSGGAQLYLKHCDSCHGAQFSMDSGKRVAPPVFAIKMHYIGTYSDKDSFVMAIADW